MSNKNKSFAQHQRQFARAEDESCASPFKHSEERTTFL
jgi:hypothetical protein